jgi:hypothetical protein
MIKLKISSLLSFLIAESILTMIFFSDDNFISGFEAILSVCIGIILTIYFDWLTKKDEDDINQFK